MHLNSHDDFISRLYEPSLANHFAPIPALHVSGDEINFIINDKTTPEAFDNFTKTIHGYVPAFLGRGSAKTSLMCAVAFKNVDLVKHLSKNCDLINVGNDYGDTPLHVCIHSALQNCADIYPVAKALLVDGIDVNFCTRKSRNLHLLRNSEEHVTPLWLAAERGSLSIIRLLIEHGGKTACPFSPVGKANIATALDLEGTVFRPNCRFPVFEDVENLETLYNAKLCHTPSAEDSRTWGALIYYVKPHTSLKDFINFCDVRNLCLTSPCALQAVASNGNSELLQYQLELGGDPNFINKNGTTPIFNAVRSDHPSLMIQPLLNSGAQINMACCSELFFPKFSTPLFVAAELTDKCQLETIEFLLARGGRVFTPLSFSGQMLIDGAIMRLFKKYKDAIFANAKFFTISLKDPNSLISCLSADIHRLIIPSLTVAMMIDLGRKSPPTQLGRKPPSTQLGRKPPSTQPGPSNPTCCLF